MLNVSYNHFASVFLRVALFKEDFLMKINKFLISGVLLGTLLFSGLVSSDVYAAGGNVMDGNQREIVGMWVEVQGGKSGWATLRGQGYSKTWSYDTQGKPYQLHVGVGGSPEHWAHSIHSPWIYNQGNHIQVNTFYNAWFWNNAITITP